MTGPLDRHQRPAGRGRVKPFGPIPGPAHFLGDVLQVAAGQIDRDAVPPHEIKRLTGVQVHAMPADSDDHFDFMMQVVGLRRIGHRSGGRNHGVGRLHEKERRFASRIVAHFARVRGIVAADTEHAPNGKACRTSGDRDRRLRWRRKNELRHQERLHETWRKRRTPPHEGRTNPLGKIPAEQIFGLILYIHFYTIKRIIFALVIYIFYT